MGGGGGVTFDSEVSRYLSEESGINSTIIY